MFKKKKYNFEQQAKQDLATLIANSAELKELVLSHPEKRELFELYSLYCMVGDK